MTKSDIANHLLDTYRAKNLDYGNSAHRTYVEFGEVALVIRISDKLSRLKRLTSGAEQNVKDESILDTIGDAITYLCMLAAELDTDIPELDTDERLEMTDNIEDTEIYLAQLANTETELIAPAADMGYYRDMLLCIWRNVVGEECRTDEYLLLAEKLFAEYERRVNEQ